MAIGRVLRRAPCPCGSLRAFADCCLAWEEAFRRLLARLAAFAATDRVGELRERAAEVFWHAETSDEAERGRSAGGDACFTEWLLQDYVPPKETSPLLGEFADAWGETGFREAQVLFGMLLAPTRAFEVTDAPGPRGVPVKDLLTGSEDLLGPLGLPDGLIRSDVCVGRLLAVGRLRRTGIGLLRFPQACQGELLAYLRAAYRLSRPGRHVSLEDYADGAAHLYHHFYLDRGRALGGRSHRTCRWIPFAPGRVDYHGLQPRRIRATLARQSELEQVGEVGGGIHYLWVDRMQGMPRGTIVVEPDRLRAEAETEEDLAKLCEFLEICLRGLVERVMTDAVPPPRATPESIGRSPVGPSGTAFIRRMLDRWPDIPSAALGEQTPRQACESHAGREKVARTLLGIERDMARQKRLGRAWTEVGPLWERLSLPHPSLPHGPADETGGLPARTRGRHPSAKR